jgi:hypothetical protein
MALKTHKSWEIKFKRNAPSNFDSAYNQAIQEYAGETDKLEMDIKRAAAKHGTHHITLQEIEDVYRKAL